MARSQRQVQPRRLYQLRVSLQYVTPEIWRRILVPERITLSDLHLTIGAAMGWKNQHMHAFHMNGETFDTVDESKKQLRGFHLLPGARFEYVYDFGDHWLHDIEVEAIVPRPSRYFFPRCTDGARQCPPEDCGGPPGYERILKLLRDPSASDPEGLRQWAAHASMTSRFDPDQFKVDDTNLWIRMVLRDRVYEANFPASTFAGDEFTYLYNLNDFLDFYPRITDGARQCPPDNCKGYFEVNALRCVVQRNRLRTGIRQS